jgi:hypothetical protein
MEISNTNEINNFFDKKNNILKSEKKTRNKPTKAEKYINERKKFIMELEKLMGLTDVERCVLLCELENNQILIKYLTENIANIQKYYKTGTWNYFVNQHTRVGETLSITSLIKSIFKDDKYEVISRKKIKKIDGQCKHLTNLKFLKV